MTFRGITTAYQIRDDADRASAVRQLRVPKVEPWQYMGSRGVRPHSQCLWCARPAGRGTAVVRYEDELITTDAEGPMELDWEKLYRMLGTHRAVLHARLGPQGLIAVAVQRLGKAALPLMPGFMTNEVIDPRILDLKGVERLSEEGHDWPDGLAQPWILGLDKAMGVKDLTHRKHYLQQVPHGLWLLTVVKNQLHVFEVLT